MQKKLTLFHLIFCLLLIGNFFVLENFAQCGNYFKLNYRAVNKINGSNASFVSSFRLDDLTGDGRLDFWNFQVNSANSTANILIYPGKASGYWDWDNPLVYTTNIAGNTSSGSVSFAKDFDGDGDIDLMIKELLVRNNGNGTFTTQGTAQLVNTPLFRIGFYDLNGDGFLDLLDEVSQPGQGHSIVYYAGSAGGTFSSGAIIYTSTELLANNKRLVGDFNGDGRPDIAFQTNGGYRILQNAGNGSFTVGSLTAQINAASFVETADFNADGKTDIIGTGGSPRKLVIFYGQTNGAFTETAQAAGDGFADFSKIVELNGDNHPDFIEGYYSFGNQHYNTYINDGSNNFTVTNYQRPFNQRRSVLNESIIFSDFSGDHKADLYDGTAVNMFGESVVFVEENVCQSFGETKRINFNGDYSPDLAAWNSADGNWSVALGGTSSSPTLQTFNWGRGSFGDIPAPGDFDGDGKTDYSVYRSSTGEWYAFLSASSSWSVVKFGLPGDIPVPNDYDGGGRTDLAVFRPSDGNWYFFFTETQQSGAVHFGLNGDKPVPADYDGDGKIDAAVYRPSEGNWYYLKSSDFNYGVVHWGISTDKPVPADYDGDGKADLAVFRDGDWYILRSLNNSFNAIHWGASGDVPIPNAFNYELAELVVYRDSARYWYRYIAQPVPDGVNFGAAGYKPVYFGQPNN